MKPYQTTQLAPTANLDALFKACGTTRSETNFRAFPPQLVPFRLTTEEELAYREACNQRDRAGHSQTIVHVERHESGAENHRSYALTFHYTDGTSQHFPAHI